MTNVQESTSILDKIFKQFDEIKIVVTHVDGQTILIENTKC